MIGKPDAGRNRRDPDRARTPSVHLYVNLDTLAFAASVRPGPYPLSDLVALLPSGAAELLGWVPAVTVHEVGFAFDPRLGGGATAFARAGLAGSADPGAWLLLGTAAVEPGRPFLLGIGLDATIQLGGIPLFGEALRGISISDLSLSYAAEPVPEGAIVLPPGSPRHPGGYAAGPVLALVVSDGVNREVLRLAPASGQRFVVDGRLVPGGPPPIEWFSVGKEFGPLTIGRIGVITASNSFGLALDSSLRTAVFRIELSGFALWFEPRSDISPRGLRVALDGLSVALNSGTLRLNGSLTRVPILNPGPGPKYEYAGSALVQAGPYALSAVGAYAELDGRPSLFVFGVARGQFGGVPAFTLTGLAAGFGQERGLVLPDSTRILDFPLVRAAVGGSRFQPPDREEVLNRLRDEGWVPPRRGAYWLAAGITFTSFQIIDGSVLFIAALGDRLEFALLGVGAVRLPKVGPAYAYAELTLRAVLVPGDGTFRADARLTPNSFVIDQNGRLEGGFSAWLWFGSHPRAGDFVVTLGGYHPAFAKPPWYPEAPRLGLSWRISNSLRLAGEAYFALTPSAVMAGGALAVNFSAGSLRAWFTARADFIMYWNPLFFDANVKVRVGASYTLNLRFIRRTFSVELGADLALWGPPFAGVVRVSWSIISFTIKINGGSRPDRTPTINWDQFQKGFLPKAPDAKHGDEAQSTICRPRAAAGLLATFSQGDRTHWLVSASGFVLLTETAVPADRIDIEGPPNCGIGFNGPRVSIYPMGGERVRTSHRVRLAPLDGHGRPGPPEDLRGWDWEPVTGNVPYAVWGSQHTGNPRLNSSVVPAMLGVRGTPRRTPPTGLPPVPVDAQGVVVVRPDKLLPLPSGPPIDGATPQPDRDSRFIVRETVAATAQQRLRGSVAEALTVAGIGSELTGGGLGLLADQVFTTLSGAPMIGPPGSTGPKPPTVQAARGGAVVSLPSPIPLPRLLPERHRSGLSAVYYRAQSGDAIASHYLDHAATNTQRRIAARHLRPGSERGAVRLWPGTTLSWQLPPAAVSRLTIDGAAPLWIVAFDADGIPLGIEIVSGASSYQVPPTAELLAISALSSVGAVRNGWVPTSPLLHVAPRSLLADGVVVRSQAPIALRRSAGEGRSGLLSGRQLAGRNRVRTAEGVRPGRLRAWFPSATTAVTVAVRADPDALVAVAELCDREAAVSLSVDGELRQGNGLRYSLDATADAPGWTCLDVESRPGWLVEGIVADEPTGLGVPETAAAGPTEVVFR